MKSFSKKVPDLKEMVMEQEWSVTILAVNKQAKFLETRLTLQTN